MPGRDMDTSSFVQKSQLAASWGRASHSKEGNGLPLGVAAHGTLVLFFTCFLSAALARQRFFHAFLLARLQVKGVTLDLLDNVFLLHLALEATQRVFEGLALLKSYLCQLNYTPKPVPFGRG
jgi:hypothetical protein